MFTRCTKIFFMTVRIGFNLKSCLHVSLVYIYILLCGRWENGHVICEYDASFIDRPKRGLCFDLNVRQSVSVWMCVCVSVWPSQYYGHTPLPIVMKLSINVLGTIRWSDIYVRICYFPPISKWQPLCGSFLRLRSKAFTYSHEIRIL